MIALLAYTCAKCKKTGEYDSHAEMIAYAFMGKQFCPVCFVAIVAGGVADGSDNNGTACG